MKYTVPFNAFSLITIHGLVSEDGTPCAQTLHKGTAKPGHHVSIKAEEFMRPDGIPPRPPSNLPPPGDQHLTLYLGERLGEGRVGSVHSVTVMETDFELPPLVVKVSQRKKAGSIAQEAWFYEELEQLQGVSIPQCYGFFQTRLQDGQDLSIWESEESDESEDEEDYEINHTGAYVNEIKYEKEIPGHGPILSILVLEKLGGNIPVGVPLDPTIKEDVSELFNDMGRFGIEPLDIRWSNILSANNDSSGKICPNHGHVHRWRLIDFDLCRKSDCTLHFIDKCNNQWLRKFFNNLVEGYIVEPWH